MMNRSPLQTILTNLIVAGSFLGASGLGHTVLAAEGREGEAIDSESEFAFERTARSVFKAHCFHCHGEAGEVESGLDLRLRRLIVNGGDSGAAIEPGSAEESLLFQRMSDGDMPPEEVTVRPTEEELQLVREWIEHGAVTARSEPESPDLLPRVTPEEREHWAFRPIESPSPPKFNSSDGQRVANPIDAFLLARLDREGRGFSPEADRRTLFRRASFDLLGLPPTPEQVADYLADESPDAWSRRIDRMLDSPRYGERWGRHWLDVVGYADSEGFTESDAVRPYAYKYRDYVIESFNADVPFDRFIVEQLAGDELVTRPIDQWKHEDVRLATATGFLRMAPDGTGAGPDDLQTATNAVVTETINIVSTSLMGMTVGCAQCHDHRFDPILHDDFYRLRAVFEPALNPANWKTPSQRKIALTKASDRDLVAGIQKRIDAAAAKEKAKEAESIEMVFQRELKKIPESLREKADEAFHTDRSKRSAEQKKLLADYPNLRVSGGSALDLYLELFEEGRQAKKELDQLQSEVGKIRSELPSTDYIRGLQESDQELPTTFIFHRGDPNQPTDKVAPGGLSVLDHLMEVDFPEDDKGSSSTGRRLALARHLTDPRNPLTPRVLVNRFWMHHFGRGLVETPGDFGKQGEPPSHPALLDWLARDFVEHGWRLKRLHKTIMMSTAYRQSSLRAADGFDPDNRLYGRQSVRRLEAETIRDSILYVSGALSRTAFGPASGVRQTSEGQTVVSADLDAKKPSRRSVYIQTRRSTPLAMLEVFDSPRLEPNCTIRTVSTVTPQSLMLMNSEVVVQQARGFADRLIAAAGQDDSGRVNLAWQIAYGDSPTPPERREAIDFLKRQRAHFESDGAQDEQDEAQRKSSADRNALSSLCMVLMGSNRFLYVD